MAKTKNTDPAPVTRRKKGSGTIIARNGILLMRWREDGKVKQESTGLTDTKTNREKAEEMLAKKTQLGTLLSKEEKLAILIRELEGAKAKIAELQEVAKPRLTLAGLADAFERSPYRKDCSEKQLAIYLQQLGAFIRWTGDESIPFAAVDDRMAASYASHLAKHFSGNTFNKHTNCLALVWKAVGRTEGVKDNPWSDIERKRIDGHTRRVLVKDEIQKILDIAKGETRDLIVIGLQTGLRLGDACRLRWEDFDGETVRVRTAKTGAYVQLPAASLLRDLSAKRKKSGYVLPETAALYDRDNSAVSRRVTTVFRSAGLQTVAKSDKWHRDRPDATFHSLRHTFVSRAIEAGIPIEFVKELVGHTTQTMTSHYSHISPEAMAAAFEKMNA